MNLDNIVGEIMSRRVIQDGIGFANASSFTPHSPTTRQKLFLELDNEREVFYGGAAGGGKSDALLMAALEYVHVPEYSALLLRKTYVDLARPGALMDRAQSWLGKTAAKWVEKDKKWVFPSGATLTFGYLETENDKFKYQSSEFQFIGFDELTHFSLTQYTYLFSRLRRLKGSDIPIRMRSGSNPGGYGGLWVKDRFIPDNFTPLDAIPEKVWEKDGIDEETGRTIKRFFVPARLDDNPHLDQSEYEESLRQLDPITRAQLRKGDWSITTKGDILDNWDENQVIVPWSRFKNVFGTEHIPGHWRLGVFQDFGTTPGHPCVTGFFATAAENAPIVNGQSLAGSVFCYRMITSTKTTARQMKKTIREAMKRYEGTRLVDDEFNRVYMWQMSHEASSERLEYNHVDDEIDYSLPFINWQTGKTRGIEQLRNAITPQHLDKAHPFNPGVDGRPKLFFLVADDEYISPRTDAGMLRVRQEAPAYKWEVPKSGEQPKTLVPHALFNDAMDVCRGAAAIYFPRIEEFTEEEYIGQKLKEKISFDISSDLSEGQQLTLSIMRARVEADLRAENINEFDLFDLSNGY